MGDERADLVGMVSGEGQTGDGPTARGEHLCRSTPDRVDKLRQVLGLNLGLNLGRDQGVAAVLSY